MHWSNTGDVRMARPVVSLTVEQPTSGVELLSCQELRIPARI